MKICIVSNQHISANPRVWKEADLFASKGYEVVIVTRFNSRQHREKDEEILKGLNPNIKYVCGLNIIPGEVSFIRKAFYRLRYEVAVRLKKIGVETKYLFSVDPDKIYNKALNEGADLYAAHVECGFYVGRKLAQKGKRVIFDFEDWYSEDYLVPTRPTKYLRGLEQFALTMGITGYCPSESMAIALAKKYNCARPEVVYNGFPLENNIEVASNDIPVMIWFSQTVGPGRGLEKLIGALSTVEKAVVLKIIGNCREDYKKSLSDLFPSEKGHKLEFSNPVPHKELHNVLCSADIGLALEHVSPESRNTTITNKILQYLQAGLKVIATDTLGQKEVASRIGDAVTVIPNNDVRIWPDKIEQALSTKVDSEKTVQVYRDVFSFEAQHDKLLKIVDDALAK